MRHPLKNMKTKIFDHNQHENRDKILQYMKNTKKIKRNINYDDEGNTHISSDDSNNDIYSYFSFVNIKDEIFALGEEIGKGSFGRVVVGRHLKQNINYAIKIQLIKNEDDIDLETKLTKKFGVSKFGDVYGPMYRKCKNNQIKAYIAMPLADMSFRDFLHIENPHYDHVKMCVKSIIKELISLHEHGYAHLDLKCGNILVKDGKVCISDFGLTAKLGSTKKTHNHNRRRLPQVAPEVYSSADEEAKPYIINTKLDVWGIGGILKDICHTIPNLHKDFQPLIDVTYVEDPNDRKSLEELLEMF